MKTAKPAHLPSSYLANRYHVEGPIPMVCTHVFFFFFKYLFIYLFIYLWLCWVFVSVRGLSLAAASGGHSSSRCAGLSPSRPLLLRSTGSRRAGSVIVAHGPSCSAACGILPDQGSNPCPLHWQADSQPLRHQGSPARTFHKVIANPVNIPELLLFFPWCLYSLEGVPQLTCQIKHWTLKVWKKASKKRRGICYEKLLGDDNTLLLSSLGNLAIIFLDTVVRSSSSSPTRGLVCLFWKLIAGTVTEWFT